MFGLGKLSKFVREAPNNFKGLLTRSEVLYCLNQFQSSLADADNALRCRPTSYKAHFRRAAALTSLGRNEEALVAHCVAVSLDKSGLSTTTALKHDITRLLHRLLVPQYRVHQSTTMPTPFRKRRKVFTVRSLSDCEDGNSSCGEEENFLHAPKRSRRSAGRPGDDVIPPPNARLRSLLERIHQEVQKNRRADSRTNPPHVNPTLIEASDFDCVLCCRTLWKPVVTPCGHTYCSICLDRCMDYKQQCPLCMFYIEDTMSLARHGATRFLEVAMQRFIPVAYTKRKRQELEPSVPIFICTTAFPSVPCPLLVSEPRYRLMVRQAIESGDRHFGIAQPPQNGRQQYFEYGTMLDIRDCVLLGNGCSILSTVGSRRFRVIARGEKDGYDTAKVEYICDSPISRERTGYVAELHEKVLGKAVDWFERLPETYKTEILRSFGHMPQVEEEWVTERDGPAWAWWIIAILPLNQQLKGTILMETNLEKRLLAIDKTLNWQDKATSQKRQSAEPCSPCGSDGLQDCPTQCPLCMFYIEDTMSLARHGATRFLEVAMQRFIPVAYTKRKRQELEPSVPIFICTTAFPSVPCPLLVSEPRYRLMVRQAIESGDRHFGIAQPSGKPPQNGRQQYFEYGTMLDIRDCVLLGNGCSILSTVGSRRFRVIARGEKDGYDTAKVEYICDSPISRERTGYVAKLHEKVLGKAVDWFERLPETYKTEILRSFGHMPQVEEEWVTERDGPAWAWWIIAILPLNQQLKGTILMETNLEKRLLAIDKTLNWQDKATSQKRQSAEPCSPCGSDGLQDCPTVDCCQRSPSSTHLDEGTAPGHATHFLM
uniref:Putative lon peptidase domain and ring finger protein 2 n=1 Tax=Lutzomyia longipalpis TaxID=7200 RepID=A0A1B0GJJ0_LUTLO